MRITISYNLYYEPMIQKPSQNFSPEADVKRLSDAVVSIQHTVNVVEVSGKPNETIERQIESESDLVFNLAEGTIDSSRETFYPGYTSRWVFS